MTIWLTRPQADSEAMAAQLAERGIASLIAPVMEIEAVPLASPSPCSAILLTSRHAVHALQPAWAQVPVYCVGTATAEAARAQGFSNIIVGESDVLALLPRIAIDLRNQSLLYLSGEDVSVDVVALLAAQAVQVERVIAYRATAAQTLPPALCEALNNNRITGAVFYSARTATIANNLLREAGLSHATASIDAYCLSLAIAQQAAHYRRIHVAHVPTHDAMLEMIAAHHAP